jgi:hypothetical protein
MSSIRQRQRETLHRQRIHPDWCTECANTDPTRLKTKLLIEKLRNGGLTPDERQLLKLLVDQARRKQKQMDERVLRGLAAQREREDRASRLTGY